MGSQREDVETQSGGAIGRPSRWSCGTLMVLTVHTFLIAACFTVVFTGFRFGPGDKKSGTPESRESPKNLILQLKNQGSIEPVEMEWTDVRQGLLHFTPSKESNNIKVNNSDILVGCQGPYIVYPYIQYSDINLQVSDKESFIITVVNRDQNILASMPFDTTDKTSWKYVILNLNKSDRISVYVSCEGDACPLIGKFCLALNFLLGSACAN